MLATPSINDDPCPPRSVSLENGSREAQVLDSRVDAPELQDYGGNGLREGKEIHSKAIHVQVYCSGNAETIDKTDRSFGLLFAQELR